MSDLALAEKKYALANNLNRVEIFDYTADSILLGYLSTSESNEKIALVTPITKN